MLIKFTTRTLSIIALLLSSHSQADVAVVVHLNNDMTNITTVQAANIFLGKTKTMPSRKLIIPIDQSRKSDIRKEFYEKLVNKNQNQLNAYWARQVFTGKSQPPIQVNNDEEVKLLIAENPNMIGYIDSAAVDDSIKVILRIP